MDLKAATTLASVIMLTFMLAEGYYVQNAPTFIAWIKYVSLSFYSFKLFVTLQFSIGDTYRCATSEDCKVEDLPSLSAVEFDHCGIAVAVLFAMFFAYRLVAYLASMRVGVTN